MGKSDKRDFSTDSALKNVNNLLESDGHNPREKLGYRPAKTSSRPNAIIRGYSPGFLSDKPVFPPLPPISGSSIPNRRLKNN